MPNQNPGIYVADFRVSKWTNLIVGINKTYAGTRVIIFNFFSTNYRSVTQFEQRLSFNISVTL
jgi:hypothetical protein